LAGFGGGVGSLEGVGEVKGESGVVDPPQETSGVGEMTSKCTAMEVGASCSDDPIVECSGVSCEDSREKKVSACIFSGVGDGWEEGNRC
jgi:hypothetical protein